MFVDRWRGKGRLNSTAQKVILAMRTCEKGRFLGSNVHIQIELDIEKYLGHYTDQTGYYLSATRPFPACSLSWTFAFQFARQYPSLGATLPKIMNAL